MGFWSKVVDGYKGAGILCYHIDTSGQTCVILGLRRIHPDINTWSIPGGKRKGEAESPLENAIREADEEGFIVPAKEREELKAQPRRFLSPIIHFFEWSTYFVTLRERPPLNNWSKMTDDFRHEFSEAQWFATNDLPNNTHIGVKLALLGRTLR